MTGEGGGTGGRGAGREAGAAGEAAGIGVLGVPRRHFRLTGSTNARARELAAAGAPHGTLVTAAEQTAGRGRQGRRWIAPAGRALLASLVVRPADPLLPLAAGVAVAEAVGGRLKWPNDVLIDDRKVAGILVEGRPQEGWAVLGIGLNVAVDPRELPPELHDRAGGLGLTPADLEPTLERVLRALEQRIGRPAPEILAAFRERDALEGREVAWAGGSGRAVGIDAAGRLLVGTAAGTVALDAGEVHLRSVGAR